MASELEFDIPFVANVPWKETIVTPYNDTGNLLKEKFSTGHISIEVLTPLRAASTSVADNCPINMWIAGGDDIAFAIPDFGNYVINDGVTLLEDEVLDAQIFNQTSKGVEHNEQISDSASRTFPISNMTETKAEELTMGEKITNLRQLIKRFGVTSVGRPYPYRNVVNDIVCFPGPIPLNNDQFLVNEVLLDPCYFGEKSAGIAPRLQTKTLPVSRDLSGAISTLDFVAGTIQPINCPLYYISYLYRFFRGSRRYKVQDAVTSQIKYTSLGFGPANTAANPANPFVSSLTGYETERQRYQKPMIVTRDWRIIENGDVTAPQISAFVSTSDDPNFEHVIYPDLNGVLEFEVPYYAQTPISLVGEGNLASDEGPLIRRSKISLRRDRFPRGLDESSYGIFDTLATPNNGPSGGPLSGGIRNCFGAYTLLEAAGDDFSFGYLVGAPKISRLFLEP